MKLILGISIPVLLVAILAGAYVQRESPDFSDPLPTAEGPKTKNASPAITHDSSLKSAPPTSNHALRLDQWAESIEVDRMAELLEEINASARPENERRELRQVLLSSWSRRDLAGLGEWFGSRYAADELHQESRDALLSILTQEKPAAAFSWMKNTLPDSARGELYEPFFRHWASFDAAGASSAILELTKLETTSPRWNTLLGETVGRWAEKELMTAVAWTRSLPAGAAKTMALEQLSYRWAKIDPQAAAVYAAEQNDPAALEAVAGTWAASDPKSAHAWALNLQEGENRNRAVAAATAVWAGHQPAAAAEHVDNLTESEGRNQARIAAAARWAETDPGKAAKWMEGFPENSAREQAVTQVITAWAISDAKEAAKWVQQLPASRSRDAAVLAYCDVTEVSEPAIAFALAGSISDPPLRQQRQERGASLWLAKDSAAARSSIASSNLPDDLKKQLLLRAY